VNEIQLDCRSDLANRPIGLVYDDNIDHLFDMTSPFNPVIQAGDDFEILASGTIQ
jgi:hypothetical protein